MAGVGIGMGHGAESALSNPALITTIEKDHEISFGGTLFMPKVKANMGAGDSSSKADMNMIPEVSLASKVNDNFYWGVGMWGTAGMGVDYRDASGYTANMNMVTNLQLMQFGVPLAFTGGGFTVAVTPILQYGALDINYDADQNLSNGTTGAGVAQDLKFGYNVGLSYNIADLTIGAVYKSKIDMEYKGQLSSATQPFVSMGIFPGAMSDELSTPAEIGVGASYKMGGSTIAVDYKQIKWSDAKGYKDFKWDDQSVLAIGYEYANKNWAIRLGYNQAKNPIKDAGAMTTAQAGAAAGGPNIYPYLGGNALNTFNLLGFPATVESHMSVGGTYAFSDTTSLDLAYVYAPETSTTLMTMPDNSGNNHSTTVKHSQTSVSFQLNYAF